MEVPWWLAKTIAWGGVLLMSFAVLEAGLGFFGVELTDGNWSTLIALAGGYILRVFGETLEED